MQVTVEQLEGLKRKLNIEIPSEDVKLKVGGRLKEVARKANLPGFRPGKTPMHVVEQRFKPAVHQEIVEKMINESYTQAVRDNDLKPAGDPKVELDELDLDKPLAFTAEIEVYPEINLKNIAAISIELAECVITDADVDKQIEQIRQRNADWQDVEREAKMGDKLLIDFEGRQDGRPLEQGSAEDFEVELGSNALIPGFEEGLVGTKAGDKKTLDLSFPEDYVAKEMAGKQAQFHVTVKVVRQAELPELNETFFKRFGQDITDLAKLKDKIRKQMQTSVDDALRQAMKQQLFDKWLALHEFPVPTPLVEAQAKFLRDEFVSQMAQYNPRQKDMKIPHEPYLKSAEKQVALGLLLQEYIRQHDLKPDNAKLRAFIEKIAGDFPDKEQFMQYYMKQPELMQQIQSRVVEDEVYEQLIQTVNKQAKSLAYDEVEQYIQGLQKEQQTANEAGTTAVDHADEAN